MDGASHPVLAYLVNSYPSATHTFIRREIEALEAAGTPVARYALRLDTSTGDDPVWRREAEQVRSVLATGPARIALAALRTAVSNPSGFARAAATAVRLGWRSRRGLPHHLIYLAEACALRILLADAGIRHVHVHFGTNAATVALLCHLLGGPTWSFTVHGPEEFDDPKGLRLGRKAADAHAVVAISDFGRSQLYRWVAPEHWDRVHVVHCTVDERFLDGVTTPVPDVPRLVSVGRLTNQKGQLLLIDAVGRLLAEGRDIELVLVGDGPMRPEVERAIAALPRPEAVVLTGSVPNEQVAEYIRSARAMVMPSFAEGLPVVIMEALALGRPVVTTTIAGIPELVRPGEHGWLVPPGSVDALLHALREVLDTPADRLTEMGAEGAAAVGARHRASTEAAKLRAVLPLD